MTIGRWGWHRKTNERRRRLTIQDQRRIQVQQTLMTMSVDFREDAYGDIMVDHDRWEVSFPEEDHQVVVITFAKTMNAGPAADAAIRFAWPLQNVGYLVAVNAGYFEPRARV